MGGVIVGKLVFGKDGLNYGLELCLAKAGVKAYPVTPATVAGCDILLVSMFWYKNLYELERFMREAGIKKGTGKPWILAGGMQATMTPEAVAGLVDWVFIGDGDKHLRECIDEIASHGTCGSPFIYSEGMDVVPAPSVCKPSAYTIQTSEGKGTLRCEVARGCRFKCAFCCLSGLKPYQEVPFTDLEPHIKATSGKRSSFFAPERTMHKEWPKIKEAIAIHGCHDMGQDARLEHLQEIDGASVTLGLEGLSERLRRSIGKAFSDDMVCERIGHFVETRKNIARVSCYWIAGLPGEADEDWDATWALFERFAKQEWSRRLVLCPILNPLSPKPFTKLKDATIDLDADYGPRWQKLLRRDGGQWGFRVVETLVWGPLERTLDAIVQRSGRQFAGIAKRMPSRLLKGLPPMPHRREASQWMIRLAENNGVSRRQLETGKTDD
jgi:radical SAM superfamily enzyme YgiQ (UPF0313 family)